MTQRALVVGGSGIVGSAWRSAWAPTARRSTGSPGGRRPACRPPALSGRSARRARPGVGSGRPRRQPCLPHLVEAQRDRGREHPRQRRHGPQPAAGAGAEARVRHVALVTGLKHYLGPFDRYAQEGSLPETPLREEQPRLDVENFYYAQEDEVYAAATERRLHLERPSPAHGDRQGRRQPDEHGHHARRLRVDLQGDRPPVPLARLAGAVAGHLRT